MSVACRPAEMRRRRSEIGSVHKVNSRGSPATQWASEIITSTPDEAGMTSIFVRNTKNGISI